MVYDIRVANELEENKMTKYELTFKYNGYAEIVTVEATSYANASYKANDIAKQKDLPNHVLFVKKLVNNEK